MNKPAGSNQIGLWTSTSLVVGNIIGVGVFLIPSTLAAYGSISFFGWLVASFGAFLLSLVFGNLSTIIPHASGGPYIYTRAGFGDLGGFLVAWGYWISVWVTNAAIAVGLVGYLSVFIPFITSTPLLSVVTGLAAIWLLTWVNTKGVAKAGKLQLVTTILKLIPLCVMSIGGLFFMNFDHFIPANLSGESDLSAIASTTTITLFAFLGIECATIPSANVKDPAKTIPKATRIGTVIAIVVYIVGSMSVMGIIPPDILAKSNAPFADAAAIMWGEEARYIVAAGAVISTFGALNGWILIQGQIPAAIAKDKLFPKIFARENKNEAPVMSIIIGSALASILMVMNYTKGLVSAFKFFLLLSTLCVLIPYLFSAAAYVLIAVQKNLKEHLTFGKITIATLAFLFSFWAIIGSGENAVYWGFLLLLAGIPFYIWINYNRK
ncbi:MAG: amino acid permease [Fulvivirga sp.]|nr:amino acid permease [Fulvivirga sp.]